MPLLAGKFCVLLWTRASLRFPRVQPGLQPTACAPAPAHCLCQPTACARLLPSLVCLAGEAGQGGAAGRGGHPAAEQPAPAGGESHRQRAAAQVCRDFLQRRGEEGAVSRAWGVGWGEPPPLLLRRGPAQTPEARAPPLREAPLAPRGCPGTSPAWPPPPPRPQPQLPCHSDKQGKGSGRPVCGQCRTGTAPRAAGRCSGLGGAVHYCTESQRAALPPSSVLHPLLAHAQWGHLGGASLGLRAAVPGSTQGLKSTFSQLNYSLEKARLGVAQEV